MDYNLPRNNYFRMPYFPPSLSPRSSFTAHHLLRDGFAGDYRGGVESRQSQGVSFMVQREMEKDRIREEILVEMARNRLLEEEVEREILMRRHRQPYEYHEHQDQLYLDLRRTVEDGFTTTGRIGFGGYSNDHGNKAATGGGAGVMRLCLRRPDAATIPLPPRPTPGKLLVMPRRQDSDIAAGNLTVAEAAVKVAKLKATKQRQELSCALCQVTATSEQALEDHIIGKKHQTKVAKLKATKPGPNPKSGKISKKKNKKRKQKKNKGSQQARMKNRFQKGKRNSHQIVGNIVRKMGVGSAPMQMP